MKKVLMIANTYYQLIIAIQIKLTILGNQHVDFILTDRTPGAQDVVDRLNDLNVFNSAVYVHVKDIDLRHKNSRFGKVVLEIILNSKRNDYLCRFNLKDNDYTELWFYNYELELYGIIDKYFINGCVLNRFEEGLFSYNDSKPDKKNQFLSWIRKKQKRMAIDDYKSFYCTNPEFIDKALFAEKTVTKIPNLCREDKNLLKILNTVFDYKESMDIQSHKILYFTSSHDVDGYPIHEEKIVEKVVSKFGKENVCLKIHPRDKRNVYKQMGVTIAENSNVPWEVIQMNIDPQNKMFISIGSGSIINSSIMLGDVITTYLLFPMIRGISKRKDDYYYNVVNPIIENAQDKGLCKCFHVVLDVNLIDSSSIDC